MGDRYSHNLLIIGLDGLNWSLLDRLFEAGAMPCLARLKAEGAWGTLASVVPTQSATAWASFITGQNPARHGVFDFTVRNPNGTYRHAKPHPAATLWHLAGQGGLRVGVFNFPVTYPPDPVNGFLVSGMLSPKGRTFTYPASLGNELLAKVPEYRLDLEWQLYSGRERPLLRDLVEMTRSRTKAICHLQKEHAPNLLAAAFIEPDRLQHPLWRHLDPTHPGYEATQASSLSDLIRVFYATLDSAVDQLIAGAGQGATVMILSDHGFQGAARQFRVDDWLEQHGWLVRQRDRSRLERFIRRFDTPWVRHIRRQVVKDLSRHFASFAPGGSIDWSQTVAFSPWNAQQGIRLNVRGREPDGIVAPGAAYERLREEISEALLGASWPETGLAVIDRVWRREELYAGPFFAAMPDLVFALRPGFASSPLQPRLWAPTRWCSGDHSLDGIFCLWGHNVRPGQVSGLELIDCAPTALYLLGLPVPANLDGKVLTAALDADLVAANPVRWEESPAVTGDDVAATAVVLSEEGALSAAEAAEVEARLRGLGYL